MPRAVQEAAVAVWSGTVSLPVADRDEAHVEEFKLYHTKLYAFFKAHFSKFIFQLEKTDPDNWHYQAYFKTERTRQRVYDLDDGLRLCCTPASTAGMAALRKYAMKPNTRQDGPWTDDHDREQENLMRQTILAHMPKQWHPWQALALERILGHHDDRKILWYSDPEGAAGKTTLAKFLAVKHDAGFFTYGDARSILTIAAAYLKAKPCFSVGGRILIFNLTKSKPKETSWHDIYAAIESIKDGFFVPTKGMDMTPIAQMSPTVVVFANEEPRLDLLARGRFEVVPLSSTTSTQLPCSTGSTESPKSIRRGYYVEGEGQMI